MGLTDLFAPETKIELNYTQLHELTKQAVKHDLLMNGINCNIPHIFLREVMTGKQESDGLKEIPAAEHGITGSDAGKIEDTTAAVANVVMAARVYSMPTWEEIKNIVQEGRAAQALTPGTEISFSLKNGDPAKITVIGVNHYSENDVVFRFIRTLGRHEMNKKNTNAGGWNKCDMRRYLNEEVINLLPDELRAVIAKHTTTQKIDGEMIVSEDFLFLPSEYEILGRNDYAEYNGIDKAFPYLAERRNRIVTDEDDDLVGFWTADPSAANTTYFCSFYHYGSSDGIGASAEGGVAPLFVIN